MMAVSVLGKRSRHVLDVDVLASDLPAHKRQTRHSTVQIFEDSQTLSAGQSVSETVRGQASRRSNITYGRNTPTKRVTQNACIPKNLDDTHVNATIESYGDHYAQNENTPPSVSATPRANRVKDCLGLKTPNTPKHRVRLSGLPLTPRTPRHETPRDKAQSYFAKARQLFTQSSDPSTLVGRESERTQLERFITTAIQKQSGGCTYVSGPPGTGKSALVQEVFKGYEQDEAVTISVVNCVSLRTASDVYGRLLQDFAPEMKPSKAGLKKTLSELFLGDTKTCARLILLDEIDNLLDTDCDVLYTIFEWALHRSSSIILVGIANALDLTDRFLPRLKARGLKPELLPILPYTAGQISSIISSKLRTLLSEDSTAGASFVPFMQPAAIQLCGKKIASQTGDLRKAFSLVRRVLEQLEKETSEKQGDAIRVQRPLGEIANLSDRRIPSLEVSPSKAAVSSTFSTPVLGLSAETAPRASVAHVARMASSVFNNSTLSRLSGLNLQQKAVLCSLVGNEKRKSERDPYATPSKSSRRIPTIKELFLKYSNLCKRDDGLLQPLKDTEFRDVVASLETLGLVLEQRGYGSSSLLTPTSTPSRAGRTNDDKQVVSAVSEKEMRDNLNGPGTDLLQRLLDEA